eukprot:4468002-Alexandrium_andersonii.AAC.1
MLHLIKRELMKELEGRRSCTFASAAAMRGLFICMNQMKRLERSSKSLVAPLNEGGSILPKYLVINGSCCWA